MQVDFKIIVCPNEEKNRLLKEFNSYSNLVSVKFMTKEEYLKKYFFDYDEEAIFYLMKHYGFHLDVAKVYLKNLYVIDEKKKYHHPKLVFLSCLKKELIENQLLSFSPSFSTYLKGKTIEVRNYYDLDSFEEKALSFSSSIPSCHLEESVYEFSTMEEEVNYVCIKIVELLKSGVDINKIFLVNVSSDYYFTINRLFSYYHIPINIDFKRSIYGTKVVQEYLKTGEFVEDESYPELTQKLASVLLSLSMLDLEDSVAKKILVDRLKHTYFSPKIFKNAVSIRDLYHSSFEDDEYVFVLGFNQDSLPKMVKNIAYLDDSVIDEVDIYDTNYLNMRNKSVITYLLHNIKHLYLSYKKSNYFQNFYPSSLINDLGLTVIKDFSDTFQYSHFYNKLRLAEKLDLYYLYGENNSSLKILNSNYSIPYRTYDNQFKGILLDSYHKNLPYPLNISYTSLNSFNECGFKYYIRHVLKIEEYKDTFASYVGQLYHYIISCFYKEHFDFEKEYNYYLSKRELSLKEKLLLVRIKRDLLSFLDVLKKQQLLTGYDDILCEKKIEIPIKKDIAVVFTGYIDKIMSYRKMDDTYFSIIDYKTGFIDTHIEPMKYGLHMQLPIYLYLLHYSKVFTNPIFTGIYYQNILFPYPTWSTKLEKEEKEKYFLNGYSTDSIDILSRFDSTYEKSEYIRSMKYDPEKGFGPYTKIIDDNMLYQLVTYTKSLVENKIDDILKADFSIHPKIYAGKNVSCEFCSFRDLCFRMEKDFIYYRKQDDFSFLGGDD